MPRKTPRKPSPRKPRAYIVSVWTAMGTSHMEAFTSIIPERVVHETFPRYMQYTQNADRPYGEIRHCAHHDEMISLLRHHSAWFEDGDPYRTGRSMRSIARYNIVGVINIPYSVDPCPPTPYPLGNSAVFAWSPDGHVPFPSPPSP